MKIKIYNKDLKYIGILDEMYLLDYDNNKPMTRFLSTVLAHPVIRLEGNKYVCNTADFIFEIEQ